jgi:hypothetical protein
MMRSRLAFQIVILSVLAMMLTTSTVFAAFPVSRPFSATIQADQTVSSGRTWVDKQGITHIRGMVVNGIIAGDINGQIQLTQNFDIDATFSGDIQATAVITSVSGELYGLFGIVTFKAGKLSGIFIIYGMRSASSTFVVGTISGMLGNLAYLAGTQIVHN